MPTSAWRVDIQRTNGSISTLYGFSMDAAKAHGAMRDTVRSNRCRNIVLKEIVDVYLAPEEEQCAT